MLNYNSFPLGGGLFLATSFSEFAVPGLDHLSDFVNRDYAATLATAVIKWFWEYLFPSINPESFLFL
jgi:hypothetical protein